MAGKAISNKAINRGKHLAQEALAHLQEARTARAAALVKAKIAPPVQPRATKVVMSLSAKTHVSRGTLVAEGDSWFDYPFNDVLSGLDDVGFDVESVAHKGDTVEEMAYADGQLVKFARLVDKVLRSGVRPRAILLSGGGNDIAGDEFTLLLNHAASSKPGLNQAIMQGVIDERMRDAYTTVIAGVTQVCEKVIGSKLPIIVHGYDYPIPDGRGFFGGFSILPGPWLEPGFLHKGYTDLEHNKQVCMTLIDRFNAMLKNLAGKTPFEHVKHLDLRSTLRNDKNYKKDWANELHPTEDGFAKVVEKFVAAIP